MTMRPALDQEILSQNVDEIRERVHLAALDSGRSADDITIVAVSKTFPRAMVDAAYALGLGVFGENRVQEATAKFGGHLPSNMRVHLIGQLQTNKARAAIGLFDRIESVDRLSLIETLEKEAAKADTLVSVLLQVNIGREPQKAGCDPDEALVLVDVLRESAHLRLDGLMGIAPLVPDPEAARPWFRSLRELRDEIARQRPDTDLAVLSMGMSGDFEAAIAEGATHVRIGSAIFGAR
jgi:pyridoxal phosphate enzyme (YggS family)